MGLQKSAHTSSSASTAIISGLHSQRRLYPSATAAAPPTSPMHIHMSCFLKYELPCMTNEVEYSMMSPKSVIMKAKRMKTASSGRAGFFGGSMSFASDWD